MKTAFTKNEIRLITGISMLMSIRTLGASLVIPVFSIFATEFPGSSEQMAGYAVGSFGLAQTIFLIPMGKLSDRFGMKQITLIGLFIYLLGSLMCGLSGTIEQLIVSRFIAGAGAVSGVTMAWLTDGIDINRRNSALSFVGMSIGASVILGFALSSVIAGKVNIPTLFYVCAALTFFTILYTLFFLKNNYHPKRPHPEDEIHLNRNSLKTIFTEPDLIRLKLTGFITSTALTAMFFAMPLLLKKQIDIPEMWKIYVPMAMIGTTFMFFLSREADRRGTRSIAIVALVFEILAFAIAIYSDNIINLFAAFIIFYSGHCILQPVLPAAVSRHPCTEMKGTTMSIFNSAQFIGSGIGGIISGYLIKTGYQQLYCLEAGLLVLAVISILTFKNYGRRHMPC